MQSVGGEPGGTGSSSGKAYRVQTGLFRRYGNALYMMQQLMEEGYEAEIVESGEYFAVQVGDYMTLSDAEKAQRQLRALGYDTLIVTV